MAPRLQWAVNLIMDTNIVPRLEDHLIDELFYQEDEIGEFRHTAFMVECGLEEDPPDGPDVDPVPWGEMLLKQQQEKEQNKIIAADENVVVKGGGGGDYDNNDDSDSDDGIGKRRKKREPPSRSRSTDDIETLAIELTSTPKARHNKPRSIPKRSNSAPLDMYVVNGESSPSSSTYVQFSPGSLARGTMQSRRNNKSNKNGRPEKHTPDKTSSDDNTSPSIRERRLESPESSRPKRITPMRGKLTQTRSGTCHEMAVALTKAKDKLIAEKEKNGSSRAERTAPVRGKLTQTRSGTCRKMEATATKAKKNMNAEKEEKKKSESVVDFPISSPSVAERRKSIETNAHKNSPFVSERRNSIESGDCKKPEKSARSAPFIRSSLVATKSGTLHGARKKERNKEESNTADMTVDDEDGPSRIVYKNGRKTVLRTKSSLSKESRSKSKSNDSESDNKKKKVVDGNGKKEIIRQGNSLSDSSFSDDQFLGDIVSESDDESVGRSVISISTCGSETAESRSSPRKEQKACVPKSITQSPKVPVRKRSLNKKELEDDDALGMIKPSSSKSMEKAKKEKKKKKKKSSEGSDDDSKHIPRNSSSSIKKKKKKKKEEGFEDETKDSLHNSFSSPIETEQGRKKHNESIYGDLQPGCYPSPSSIRSQNRKRISITKSSPTEPQKDNVQSPSIIKIKRRQGQTNRPEDFVCTDPLAVLKKKREKAATTSPVKPIRENNRPDDWLGSGKTTKRTWRVKTKLSENTP
jgi:hypothetical protein